MSLSTLLRRAEKATAKAELAGDASRMARYDLNTEARRIAWAALEKRGVKRGDRIGFTDPKRARWHDIAPRLDALESYRARDHDGNHVWRVRLRLTTFNSCGAPHKTPASEYFDMSHPREIGREVTRVDL